MEPLLSSSPEQRHRPRRDWRLLLPELAQMVPWPRDGGGTWTEVQVLQNVLGYIEYLQERVRVARAAAGLPPGGDTAEPGPSAGDTLSPPTSSSPSSFPSAPSSPPRAPPAPEEEEEEEEEDEEEDPSPWLCPTGPYWEELGREEEGVTLCPPPQRQRGLGLSPSLLTPPAPPGPPEEVIRELFPDVYLSPQEPEEATSGDGGEGTRGGPRGRGGPHGRKRKCVNGFIMFCRVNRREYMSVVPGLTSTAATRDLAQLWRSLGPDERRPYCRRARRFSRQHDRMVRLDRGSDSDRDSDSDPATPLRLLLAAHAPGGTP